MTKIAARARLVQRVDMTARIEPAEGLDPEEAKQRWLELGNRIIEDDGDAWIGAVSSYVLIGLRPADGQSIADFLTEVKDHDEIIERIDFGRGEIVIKREDGSDTVDWIEEN